MPAPLFIGAGLAGLGRFLVTRFGPKVTKKVVKKITKKRSGRKKPKKIGKTVWEREPMGIPTGRKIGGAMGSGLVRGTKWGGKGALSPIGSALFLGSAVGGMIPRAKSAYHQGKTIRRSTAGVWSNKPRRIT